MNKTTSRVQKFRPPVVRKFPNYRRETKQADTYNILASETVTGWKAMKATNN